MAVITEEESQDPQEAQDPQQTIAPQEIVEKTISTSQNYFFDKNEVLAQLVKIEKNIIGIFLVDKIIDTENMYNNYEEIAHVNSEILLETTITFVKLTPEQIQEYQTDHQTEEGPQKTHKIVVKQKLVENQQTTEIENITEEILSNMVSKADQTHFVKIIANGLVDSDEISDQVDIEISIEKCTDDLFLFRVEYEYIDISEDNDEDDDDNEFGFIEDDDNDDDEDDENEENGEDPLQ